MEDIINYHPDLENWVVIDMMTSVYNVVGVYNYKEILL